VAVSDYDNKWISIHEPGGKFLSKIGSNKVKKVNKTENFIWHIFIHDGERYLFMFSFWDLRDWL
jgi:hypothetical protein